MAPNNTLKLPHTKGAPKVDNAEVEQLRKELELAKTSMDSLQKTLADTEGEKSTLQQESENLKGTVNALETAKKKLEKSLEDTKTILKDTTTNKDRFENACNALTGREESHLEEKRKLKGERDDLEHKVQDINAAKQKVEESLAVATEEGKVLEKLEATNKRLGDDATQLRLTNQDLVTKNSMIRAAKEGFETEILSFEREAERREAENGAYKAAQARLESEIKKLKNVVEQVKTERLHEKTELSDLKSALLEANEAKEAL